MASLPLPNGDTSDGGILPADLLYEILLCLPAKPLCRFRAVCRSWRSLLSTPSFVASHAARQQPLFAVGAYECDGHGGEPANVHILDASGQVVKRVYVGEHAYRGIFAQDDLFGLIGAYCRLHVLDPATGGVTALPDERLMGHYPYFALGRAASTGEFKVLSVLSPVNPRHRLTCRIVTLGAGSGWREAQASPQEPAPFKRYAAVNGVLYFLTTYGFAVTVPAFDLEKEQWRPSLRAPKTRLPSAKRKDVTLAELNGRLAMVCEYSNASVEIWFLMDSHDVLWSKQYSIIMPYHPIYGSERRFEALSVLDDGRIVFWEWHSSHRQETPTGPTGMLRVYDPRSNMCKDVVEMANLIQHGVSVYKGSLLAASV